MMCKIFLPSLFVYDSPLAVSSGKFQSVHALMSTNKTELDY